MKFKSQEESKDNPFLKSVCDLIIVNKQFVYAISSINKDRFARIIRNLKADCGHLIKLAICLSEDHKSPTITVEYSPAESIKDLKTFEEKYYNMLKEIANNALEENNAEVFTYLSSIITEFDHYFCTLNEDNDSGETGS